METLTNAAAAASAAASKVIWGENANTQENQSGTEPISGETGNTAKGEPYDAGNTGKTSTTETTETTSGGQHKTAYASLIDPNIPGIDDNNNHNSSSTTADNASNTQASTIPSTNNTSTTAGNNPNTDSSTGSSTGYTSVKAGNTSTTGNYGPTPSAAPSSTPGNTASTGPIRPEHETDKTGVTSAHQPSSGFSSDKPTSSNDNSGLGAAPSVGADPASGSSQDTVKHQGAADPTDEPSGDDENQAIKETKKEAEEAANVETSGKGPKPLSEVRSGAGAGHSAGTSDDGPQKESHGEGTGEKYVKSSGMKADGGDFDASNPGAGKEADRLLETKGIHREDPNHGSEGAEELKKEGKAVSSKPDAKTDAKTETKSSKPSLGEKIKAKLHKS